MRISSRILAFILLLNLALLAWAQEKSVNPGINNAFENPDLAEYIKRFETDSREVFAQREAIVAALGLRPGMAVADIGAGTGLFTRMIAQRVGPHGKVYAVDISRTFLDHIAAESARLGHKHVETVRSAPDATNLPPNSIDLAFVCDTYHHFEYPAKTLASLRQALRPGGQLVVVEFDRREGVSSAFVLEHVRSDKKTFLAEIESAGFEPIATGKQPAFKESFFARFRKKPPTPTPQSASKPLGFDRS